MNINPPCAYYDRGVKLFFEQFRSFCAIRILDANARGYEDGIAIELPLELAARARAAVGAFNAAMDAAESTAPLQAAE